MQPLSEQFRPLTFEEIVGQKHLVGPDGFLTRILAGKKPLSLIFWGPPGSGKTTLARLYAKAFDAKFIALSAVFSGIPDLKKIIQEAEAQPLFRKQTILFVDEIHRFNKAQQDAFLPFVEKGTLVLVGATTENPSFSLNNALLSRVRVLNVHPLEREDLKILLERYQKRQKKLSLEADAIEYLVDNAQGDGRYLFNLLENIESVGTAAPLSKETLAELLQRKAALFDKSGDGHYNLISALHKAVRGSDPDAALYWLCRMLEGGEDPLYLARRLIRMATEDIGLADPDALKITLAARETFEKLGSPEGELALAQACIYLALSPKSNAVYAAYNQARALAMKTGHLNPPLHILNAPTKLMKDFGYGKKYQYDHDTEEGCAVQEYFPEGIEKSFYLPQERGFERELKKRLAYFRQLRKKDVLE